jgi:hypothetical protein
MILYEEKNVRLHIFSMKKYDRQKIAGGDRED